MDPKLLSIESQFNMFLKSLPESSKTDLKLLHRVYYNGAIAVVSPISLCSMLSNSTAMVEVLKYQMDELANFCKSDLNTYPGPLPQSQSGDPSSFAA